MASNKITRRAIFVSITNAQKGLIPDITAHTPLVDRARGFWLVNTTKALQCDLLVGVNNGTIEGVWEIDKSFKWQRMTAMAIPTRNLSNTTIDPRRKYCKVKQNVPDEGIFVGRKLSSVSTINQMCFPVRYNF